MFARLLQWRCCYRVGGLALQLLDDICGAGRMIIFLCFWLCSRSYHCIFAVRRRSWLLHPTRSDEEYVNIRVRVGFLVVDGRC